MAINITTPMKILVISPAWIGDMIMSQSFYISLKKLYPQAQIDVLAPNWCKPILERMPEINQALEMPLGHGEFSLSTRWKLGKKLANNNYTHSYTLPNSAKSALIPFFAKIPYRCGWKGEMRYGLLNDLRADKKIFQYMVERYVALAYSESEMLSNVTLNSCPKPKLNVELDNQRDVMEKLGLNKNKKIIGLCPGAEFGPAKRWPPSYYAALANELINLGYQIWLFGSAKDRETTSEIVDTCAKDDLHNLAGKTDIVSAIDLIDLCELVVCNDSGLMHIAAALSPKIIAIYGSTSPLYTPPLTNRAKIMSIELECRPCFKRECPLAHLNCLVQLKPKLVIDAAIELLK